MANANRSWTERRGLLLSLATDDGLRAVGEASPLPGYSPDSLAQARSLLRAWIASGPEEPTSFDELRSALAPLPPGSARFAVETALAGLLARRRGGSLAALFTDARPVPIRVAVLAPDPGESAPGGPGSADEPGLLPAALKVKIGRPGRFDDELRQLERLRRVYGDRLALRLDANGALPPAHAAHQLRRLAAFEPEWIEEPVRLWQHADRAAWETVFEEPPAVPLAFDESLAIDGFWSSVSSRTGTLNAAAVVLKPAVLGGLLPCLELARQARAVGLRAVASHCMDGPVAMGATVALAAVLTAEEVRAAEAGPSALADDASMAAGGVTAHGVAPHAGLYAWRSRPELFDDELLPSASSGATPWPG